MERNGGRGENGLAKLEMDVAGFEREIVGVQDYARCALNDCDIDGGRAPKQNRFLAAQKAKIFERIGVNHREVELVVIWKHCERQLVRQRRVCYANWLHQCGSAQRAGGNHAKREQDVSHHEHPSQTDENAGENFLLLYSRCLSLEGQVRGS